MKKTILSFSILCFTIILSGQEIRLSVGPTLNYTPINKDVHIGTSEGYFRNTGVNIGINYLLKSNSIFRIGFGLGYQSNQISVYRGFEGSSDFQGHNDQIKLFSLNLKSVLTFNKNFYLSLDPMLEMQLKYDPKQYLDKQNGVGLSAGLGKDFKIKNNIALYLEPRLWIHNLIPLQNAVPTRLLTFGLNLGLTYKDFK